MRIAVISDIHSNLLALNLSLNDLPKENIDCLVFLGDYITDGENENEILNIVKTADYAILGNREKYMLNYNPAKKDYKNYQTIATTFNNLSKDSFSYLKSLKETQTIQINGFKILMIHGDGYYNDTDDITTIFNHLINDYDFDICLFGHSHRYLHQEYQNKIFINPGSIGQPCDYPTYKYCIVEITDKVEVFLKEFKTSDTLNELISSYETTDYYQNNYEWSQLVLFGIRDGKDYCSPFVQFFHEKIKNKENITADEFNQIWHIAYEEYTQIHHLI